MKKIALLLVLVLTLSLCLTFTSVCFAWFIVTPCDYYYESTNKAGIQTYVIDNGAYKPSIIIPYTYFFKVTGDLNDGHYKISYNGKDDLYILENISGDDVRLTSYSDINNPYYNVDLPAKTVQFYNKDFVADGSEQSCSSIIFIGYTKHEEVYYFLVNATFSAGGTITTETYVKAEDVFTDFNPERITPHPDSKKAKDDQEAKDIEVAQNKIRRNIFIGVIGAVCVLIVVLIYNPFKKRQVKKTNPNMTADDDF